MALINKGLLKHVLFWIGVLVTGIGGYEQALDAGVHPIIGTSMGFPFLHHYVWGLILIVAVYFTFTREDWEIRRLIENEIKGRIKDSGVFG